MNVVMFRVTANQNPAASIVRANVSRIYAMKAPPSVTAAIKAAAHHSLTIATVRGPDSRNRA